MHTPDAAGTGRSAFAAAAFSALLPGLGQAYLRHYGRALAWASPYILLLALLAGIFSNEVTRQPFLVQFSAPSWLLGTIFAIGIDLIYRIASVLDAYRLARREPAPRGGPGLRLASTAGLVAVLLVLVVSHVALARPIYSVYSALTGIGSGDDDPIEPQPSDFPTFPPVPSLPPATAEPSVDGTPPVTEPPAPTATPGLPWDGTERLNIVLIGADRREDGGSYLTDTMIVVTIDPVTKQVGFITIPRDTTQVPLPRDWPASRNYGGTFPSKINTIYTIARLSPSLFPGNDAQRGYIALKGALSELYQLDVKYYVAVDLAGFTETIDQLNGVVIDVQVPVDDVHYPTDDGRGSLKLHIPAGIQYMNGQEALAFARARHETSDFDRSERQQRVITSVRQQTDLGEVIANLDSLLATFRKNVKTDIPPELFPRLLGLVGEIDLDQRVSLNLNPPTYSTQCYPCPGTGLYELRANVPAIRRAVAEIFTTTAAEAERRQKLEAEGAVVEVLNGTAATNTKTTKVSEYLASIGVNATVPPVNGGLAAAPTYTQTVMTAYNGVEADMPETIAVLEEVFGVGVEVADDAARAADIVIIVGTETPDLKP
ncbi:MAG: LCP family protein [Chloroflexi bacterium]|nr:LCP family protein [Chloroflexota bacterium]